MCERRESVVADAEDSKELLSFCTVRAGLCTCWRDATGNTLSTVRLERVASSACTKTYAHVAALAIQKSIGPRSMAREAPTIARADGEGSRILLASI
jgi:hypothetical protein